MTEYFSMQQMPMTPKDYLEIVKRRKWSLTLPAVIVILTAGVVALMLPSVYQSQSTILIEEQEIPSDFVMATVTGYAEQRIQQINQRIMSFSRLVEIIQRFNLYPELKDKWTTEEIVAKMKEDTILEPVSAEIVDKRTGRPTTAMIAFTLSYAGKHPEKVQQTANMLTSLFLEENLQVRAKQASDTTAFLETEMDRVKAELAAIESEIANFKEAHMNELPEMLQLNMQTLNNIERNIELSTQQLRTLKEKEEYLQTQLASITPYEEEQSTRQRLEELKVQLVHLTKRFSEEYPDVKKTRAEIADLEEQLNNPAEKSGRSSAQPDNPAYITLAAQLASNQSEMASVKRQIQELNSSVDAYRMRIAGTPKVEEAYNVLMIARVNTQAKYDDLMRKHMEARVAHGLEKEQKGERFTLIEPPRLPEKPYKPNRLAIMLIGIVLGMGAGVGMAALREFSDDAVRSADSLTLATRFPVLAGIPEIQTREDIARQRMLRIAGAGTLLLVIVVGVAIFHFAVMDLDVFWAKLIRKFSL
jgi:polysaccharide chain length determinant protein (PEP-CTERM system associated)